MNFEAWYDRLPTRLASERAAYKREGLDFQLNEALRVEHGFIVFDGTVSAGGQEHQLRVVYPAGFPLVRPEVIAGAASLPRHQNPYEANMCLLPNDQAAWQETDTGALMVRQAIELLDATHAGEAVMAAREVDAPEPASTWYPYSASASLIILEQPSATEPTEFGDFDFVMPASGRMTVQAVLTKMRYASQNKAAPPRPQWSLPDSLMPLHTGQIISGTWIRCDTPPPFLKSSNGGRASHSEYLQWAKSHEKNLSYRLATFAKKQNGIQAFALVYPDEGPIRGQYHDNWLVGIEAPALTHPVLLRPILWTREDQFRRQPSLCALEGKKVLIVGLGALGASLAAHLARAGVGQLGLVDPDFVDAGPLVRQDFDLHDIGLLKTDAVALRAKRINPRVTVEMFPFQLGAANLDFTSPPPAHDPLVAFAEAAQNYDLLISTTGTTSVDRMLNEIASASATPGLFTWVLNGAWGGRVFRTQPGGACYECLMHSWQQFGHPEEDPSEIPLFARGCGFPTFTGTGFDAGAVAGLAARLSVQTLLAGENGAYPDCSANLMNWSSRGGSAGKFPLIDQFMVPQQEHCQVCQRYGR